MYYACRRIFYFYGVYIYNIYIYIYNIYIARERDLIVIFLE